MYLPVSISPRHQMFYQDEQSTYIGCYRDGSSPRAMDGVEKYTPGDMTNEVGCYIPGIANLWQRFPRTEHTTAIANE